MIFPKQQLYSNGPGQFSMFPLSKRNWLGAFLEFILENGAMFDFVILISSWKIVRTCWKFLIYGCTIKLVKSNRYTLFDWFIWDSTLGVSMTTELKCMHSEWKLDWILESHWKGWIVILVSAAIDRVTLNWFSKELFIVQTSPTHFDLILMLNRVLL